MLRTAVAPGCAGGPDCRGREGRFLTPAQPSTLRQRHSVGTVHDGSRSRSSRPSAACLAASRPNPAPSQENKTCLFKSLSRSIVPCLASVVLLLSDVVSPADAAGLPFSTPLVAPRGPSADIVPADEYYKPKTPQKTARERAAAARARPAPTREEIDSVKQSLADAREALDREEYTRALEIYTRVANSYPDLALSHGARMGRIEALYELGEREDAFLELEDELVEVGVGNAQVHAAMAAMLHTQRPQQELRAESEWEKAVELAPRFSDPDWVKRTHHWPPSMLRALVSFLALS